MIYSLDKNIVIYDLDGTLAINKERLSKSVNKSGNINWKKFLSNDLIAKDLPNIQTIKTANLFHQNGFKVYIFSGRSESTKDATIKWLKKYEIKYDLLKMRRKNDNRPDEIIKKEFVVELNILDKIFLIFDDRDKVVRMWRSMSLTCFQVAEGAF